MQNEATCCEFLHIHTQKVQALRQKMPSEESLFSAAAFFRVLGDGTRMKILAVLLEGELCVCDIAAMLGMSISAVSHQLRVLRTEKLVCNRREGKTVFYSLADDHVRTILCQTLAHMME